MANGNQNNTAAAGGQSEMGQTGPVPTGASQQIQQEVEVATSERQYSDARSWL